MAKGQLAGFIRQLSRFIGAGPCASVADSQLLRRFVDQRDQEAFAELLQRHGQLVLGTCRQVLRDGHDAEDAFQATFLVLARKAASIRQGTSLAGWLYRVAYRIALNLRSNKSQRKELETQVANMATASPVTDESAWQELRPVLHEEVGRLPDRYRLPVVLCYLQSKTNEEAATELGWPVGTVKGRLNRARDLLRSRLERRGLALAAGLFAADGLQALATAAVPASLADRTMHAALAFATHTTVVAGAASPSATQLAEGVINAMWATKLKVAVLVTLSIGVLTMGGGTFLYQVLHAQDAGIQAPVAGQAADDLSVAPLRGQPPAKPDKNADEMTALLKARVAVAQKGYKETYKGLGEARRVGGNAVALVVKPEEVYAWSIRWLQAAQAQNPKDAAPIAALEEHLKRVAELEMKVKKMGDLLPETAALEAEWYRLEAEFWLAQANAKK